MDRQGLFVIVQAPESPGGQHLLRVGNIGDSRVLLGGANGTIFKGPGTDDGLTTDHKPNNPSERARIMRNGGTVEDDTGVARVNGELAVSRSFGDAQYKETGGPGPEERPVCAVPEFLTLRCDATDILLLVCDGVSEGDFPNRSVVRFAAEKLSSGGVVDPGKTATAVIREALKSGSKDNLSCMVVLLGGGELTWPEQEFFPGPFEAPDHQGFQTAYTKMASHGNCTLRQALALRHGNILAEKMALLKRKSEAETTGDGSFTSADEVALANIETELAMFGDGPPSDCVAGTDEHADWFGSWLEQRKGSDDSKEADEGRGKDSWKGAILNLIQNNQQVFSSVLRNHLHASSSNEPGRNANRAGRAVKVSELEVTKAAVERYDFLTWNDDHIKMCGKKGIVSRDADDGTSEVSFPSLFTSEKSFCLPTEILTDVGGEEDKDNSASVNEAGTA